MVEGKLDILKKYQGEYHEDNQGDSLLHYFQLHQAKRAAVFCKANSVGGYLETVFKKSKSPAK